MVKRIHILGASCSGTTTLGRGLAERLQYPHFETDDYFWLPTDPPYTQQRVRTERAQLLMDEVTAHDAWVVSGSLCGWGDVAIPLFELVAFCGFPMLYGWHVFINENASGLGNASFLVGTCTSYPKRFWHGQGHM